MTVVEFFEKSPFENMVSCLTIKPKKLIFLGDKPQMAKTISTYEKFLASKYQNTKIVPLNIDKNNLQNIVATLVNIIKT